MNIKFILIILLLVNCKTGERLLSLSDDNHIDRNLNNNILFLEFKNLPDKPVDLEIKLQLKNNLNSQDKFEPDYSFNSEIKQNRISIEIPKGEYFGSIKVRYKHVSYFYKSIYANHTIFFAVNKYYQKNNIPSETCSQYTSDSGSMSEFTMTSTFCGILSLDKKSKNYVFSFQKQG